MLPSHVLIIDDNALNIEVLQMLLQNAGLRATAMTAPRQLPEMLPQMPDVALVFLDLEFPSHDGFELLNDLRRYPQFANIPIIAYSVHISEIASVRQAGFDGFLGKPLDASTFPERLERILKREPVWEVS